MRFRATATIQSPLAVSARRATGNDLATQAFLPGTTVRGAAAAVFLETAQADAPDFRALFLEETVRFGDLRKEGAFPWPRSARRCKEYETHRLRDVLLGWGAKALGERIEIQKKCNDGSSKAPCPSKIAVPDGYGVFDAEKRQYEGVDVGMRRVAHIAMDPDLLRPRSGEFHTSRVIHSHQIFEGFFHAESRGEDALRRFFERERTLCVGRGRSRGQGRIALSLSPEPAETAAEMAAKISALNETAGRFATLSDRIVFTCTLLSAAILLDDWLLPKLELDVVDFGVQGLESFAPIAKMTRSVDIAGWHAKAQLPKNGARALAPGSCFLFARPLNVVEDRAMATQRLAEILVHLQERGLGERREEGFGEASFCLPFHYEKAEGA